MRTTINRLCTKSRRWVLCAAVLLAVALPVRGEDAPANAAATPLSAPAVSTDIAQLESVRERNKTAPDEPVYAFGIEERVNADAKVSALHAEIATREAELVGLREKYVDGAPSLQKAEAERTLLKQQRQERQRTLREQFISSTLAQTQENEALAGQPDLHAVAVDDLVAADPRVVELQAQITPLELEVQQKKATYLEDAPQLKVLKRKLVSLNEQMAGLKSRVREEMARSSVAPGGGPAPEAPGAPIGPISPISPSDRLAGILDQPISVDFQQVHLQDIVDFISQALSVNIVVDSRVVASKGPVSADKDKAAADAAKYVTDGMVSRISETGVPLRVLLKRMLGPLGLDYAEQTGFIWISSPARVRHESFEELELRRYDLSGIPNLKSVNVNADLPNAAPGGLDLVDVLNKSIPVINDDKGAAVSSIQYDVGAKELVVRTTPTNQRKVQRLLELFGAGDARRQP